VTTTTRAWLGVGDCVFPDTVSSQNELSSCLGYCKVNVASCP
jgi:hypothetical protein